jgi:hypothetical protein
MIGNPFAAQRVADERRKDALREAEQARLIRAVNSARPGLLDRVSTRTGSFLISAGKRLQGPHAPAQTGFAASPSPCKPMTKPS